MTSARLSNTSYAGMFVLLSCLFFAWGCPSENPPPDGAITPDGGTVDKTQPITCEKGTLCIRTSNKDARSCDILLKNDKDISNPQVSFDDSTIGQFKHRDTRLALSFILTKDSSLGPGIYPILIKLEAGVEKLEISSATCYDRKGASLSKAEVTLERP